MKTVRPIITKTEQQNKDDFIVEELMETLLSKEEQNPNEVKVEFTLTKRQYELWLKKGGVKWLKKNLI